jgi:hypothetical protein
MATAIDFCEAGLQHFGGVGIPETLHLWIRTARMTTHAAAQKGEEVQMDG